MDNQAKYNKQQDKSPPNSQSINNQYKSAGIKAGSAVLAQAITWPMEYAKTIKQFDGFGNKNIYHTLKHDIKINGFRNMAESMVPQLGIAVPKYLIRFGVYDNLIKRTDNQYYKFGAGFAAGAIEAALVTTPAETVKVQLIRHPGTTANTVKYMYKNYGLKSFWQGGSATIARQCVNQGVSLYINHKLHPILYPHLGDFSGFAVGALGGVAAVMVTNPIDVVKTRQQEKLGSSSTIKVFKDIYKKEGLTGYYRGALLRASRVGPFFGLTFFFYDLFSSETSKLY